MNEEEIAKLEANIDFRVSQDTVDKHDTMLLKNINDCVGPDDVLWHLGDFCFGPKDNIFRIAQNYRRRINCAHINFIWGNHDRYEIGPLFESTNHLYMANIDGQRIVLCHYAMAIWDGSHKGNVHLYGHSHSGAENWFSRVMPDRKAFDCGVDNAYKLLGEYRPFSFDEVMKIMDTKKGQVIDHHEPWLGKDPNKTEEQQSGFSS
jgi:calcineurin-like phosphoesterase family protein